MYDFRISTYETHVCQRVESTTRSEHTSTVTVADCVTASETQHEYGIQMFQYPIRNGGVINRDETFGPAPQDAVHAQRHSGDDKNSPDFRTASASRQNSGRSTFVRLCNVNVNVNVDL